MLICRTVLILILSVPLAFGQENTKPPRVPENCIYKPTFMTGYTSFTGGTCFLCTVPEMDGVFMLTAHNLFGKACGLTRDYTWEEMPKLYQVMTALSMTDIKHSITSSLPLTIPGARGMDKSGYDHDLAGYRVDSSNSSSALTLSAVRPMVGQIVYLLARQHGKEELEMMRAIVRKSSEAEFEYTYFSVGLNLVGTSGAPVLNQNGEVVAINIGGDIDRGRWGIGNPCSSILPLLQGIKP